MRIEIDDERDEYLRAAAAGSGLWRSEGDRDRLTQRVAAWLSDVIDRDQPSLARAVNIPDRPDTRSMLDAPATGATRDAAETRDAAGTRNDAETRHVAHAQTTANALDRPDAIDPPDTSATPNAPDRLAGLVALLQEDVVIVTRAPGAPAIASRAVYVNVSFPSGWCPPCVCGKSFVAIHAPVPNIAQFDGPGRRSAAEQLFTGEDLVRFVWTLTPDDRLDRRQCRRDAGHGPAHDSVATSWVDPQRLYLRVERQVIAPIDADTTCFFIRVYRYPAASLPDKARARIRSSIETMPEAVLRYKGLQAAVPQILALL